MKVKKLHRLEELTWFAHNLEGYEGEWYKKTTVDEAIEELATRTCENCGKYVGPLNVCDARVERPHDRKPFGCNRFTRQQEPVELKSTL